MLYLHGLGHFHPENVITNRFLAELDIGSSEEWILERVGIKTRRTTLSLDYIRETKNRDIRAAQAASVYTSADMAAKAAHMALERANLTAEDIGLVVSGSTAAEHVCPAEAAAVAGRLGITAPCFDINSACSTFGMQINILSSMKPDALPPFVLVVTPENMTRVIDYSDRRSAPLFGDGAAASVVSSQVPSRMEFLSGYYASNTLSWDKVSVPRTGYFSQDGNAVQGFAIRKTTDMVKELQGIYAVNGNRFFFVGHQANFGMLTTVCERCGITDEHHWFNVDTYGNTGGAGAPCVLSQHWNDIGPGDYIGIVVVGAGLTWARVMLKVSDQR